MTATLGEALAVERRALGFLQSDVAQAMGISVTYLSDIEQGRRKFPTARLGKLPLPLRASLGRRIIADYKSEISNVRKIISAKG
jgi:transcriptional regulator with XRE-family HTH domain